MSKYCVSYIEISPNGTFLRYYEWYHTIISARFRRWTLEHFYHNVSNVEIWKR